MAGRYASFRDEWSEEVVNSYIEDLEHQQQQIAQRLEDSSLPLPGSEYPVHTLSELLDRVPPPMLVEDLIIENSLVQIAAEPGMGKSFIAIDLALSIATGAQEFLGRQLYRQGPVFYVVGEGAGRFGNRLKVWLQQHDGVERHHPFYWTDGPIDLMNRPIVEKFVAAITPLKPALVVIDTLSRCMVGVPENDVQSMSVAVQNCDLIKSTGATVLILHHMNASGERTRGSTAMPGGLDTLLYLKAKVAGKRPVQGHTVLTTEKEKELDDDQKIELVMQTYDVEGMFEASGEPMTSVLWVPATSIKSQMAQLLEMVTSFPGESGNAIIKRLGGKRPTWLALIRQAETEGRLRRDANDGLVKVSGRMTAVTLMAQEEAEHDQD